MNRITYIPTFIFNFLLLNTEIKRFIKQINYLLHKWVLYITPMIFLKTNSDTNAPQEG